MAERRGLAGEALLVPVALQYFTRLPWPAPIAFSQERLDRSIRYLPLVGIVIGAGAGAGYALAALLWPPPVAAALAIALAAALTGGLHEDGLGDFCDGFLVARGRAETLAIMRDPRLGSHGVLGLVLVLLLRFAALSALDPAQALPGLIAAHAFSRLLALGAMRALPYARPDGGTPKPAAAPLGPAGIAIAGACGLAPLLPLGVPALPAALGGLATALLLAILCRRRLGGYTGDCLGAIQQAGETVFYLGLLA